MFLALLFFMGVLLSTLFPPTDIGYDYSNVQTVNSNYTLVCYKATGSFFHPYLKVDCTSKSAELTKNESQGVYYFNTLTNKSCIEQQDCSIPYNKTWIQKNF
jgi:hypothetical protein